jgi:2-polyprenyl-6-methoxyphenol hydroxylase-like FAD-dependent oxidoreductase
MASERTPRISVRDVTERDVPGLTAIKGNESDALHPDRDPFPSDHLYTHWIYQPGIAPLARWGLRERLIPAGCPSITKMAMDLGPFALQGTPPPAEGISEAYCPRRYVLDKLLVDAAVESGAWLRESFSVQDLVWDGDRVSGMSARSATGALVIEHARIAIGGDGLYSLVARQVEAPIYNERPIYQCAYYSYWSGLPQDSIEFYPPNVEASGRCRPTMVSPPISSPCRTGSSTPFAPTSRRASRRLWTWRQPSPSECARGRGRSALRARRSCPASSESPTVQAGRWSGTTATTRIRTRRRGSAMPSGVRSC